MTNLFDKVLNALKSDERYFTVEGEFLKNAGIR